jgi:ribonuclease Z
MGVSLAGVRTALYIPELKICFDAGFPFPFHIGADTFFITHGHTDHAAAIPYIISQKNLNNQKPARFYMPEDLVEPLTEIMQLWQKIEKHTYRFEFLPLVDDTPVELNQQFFMRSFKAHHRIKARGYTLFERRKHLKTEYQGLSKQEIISLKSQGIAVDAVVDSPLMSFSGDTQIEFLWQHDWISASRFLLIETTYIDERKTTAQAREWGHIHLDELLEALPRIKAENIVLMHLSSRYGDREAQDILAKKIPPEYRSRISMFQGR